MCLQYIGSDLFAFLSQTPAPSLDRRTALELQHILATTMHGIAYTAHPLPSLLPQLGPRAVWEMGLSVEALNMTRRVRSQKGQ